MSKSILLIEDDTVMRENTAELLELSGYEVETAENGMYGVDKAKKVNPDLIICDIMMPELDGYGVLYLLSKDQETSDIPFIFLTAKTERIDMRKGMEMGADDYLSKPFEEEELIRAIETRLKRKETFQKGFEEGSMNWSEFMNEARALTELSGLSNSEDVRKFKKGSVIFQEGEHPKGVYLIAKGRVKQYKSNEFAKELVTGLYKEGDFFGHIAVIENQSYSETCEVLEDVEAYFVSKEDFLLLLHKNRDVSSRFIKMMANDIRIQEEKLMSLAYDSVRKKAAESLLQLRKSYTEEGVEKGMAISRSDLASIAGTATESLIRALTDLKEEGYIKIKGKEIIIVNHEGLEQLKW